MEINELSNEVIGLHLASYIVNKANLHDFDDKSFAKFLIAYFDEQLINEKQRDKYKELIPVLQKIEDRYSHNAILAAVYLIRDIYARQKLSEQCVKAIYENIFPQLNEPTITSSSSLSAGMSDCGLEDFKDL